ncbi:hypothetical protein KUM42_04240 [Modestobacter sp. L9-4]|uniref:hypothetical protein n=1 Tax=Modestobacter sp. L9-4 TaxID=2851567 RepID=UPI001C7964A8|nr:hypothetical protein [Modestobacter sp. L9-4]QXG76769.1 hypothetical protein KUM42_04240 [Modestobacter sp. L9-4]
MSSYRYKPSKPMGVLSIVVGIGMLVVGLTQFGGAEGGGRTFLVVWCIAVVGITGVNAWAAFSEKGSLATYRRVPDELRADEPGADAPR